MFDDWRYEHFSPNGGAGARGLRRTLSGSGLTEAYRLGREIPQNSNDACRDLNSGVVRLTFRLEMCDGTRRKQIADLLHADTLLSRGVLKKLPDSLPLLFIEDHGTLGLGGAELADEVPAAGQKNRYVGLCMTFGDAAKDAAGGGTFGFGKSVLWNASQSRIVLFHSRFDADSATKGVTSRLVGCALFDSHANGGKKFTGRAFLGKNQSDNYTGPLTDKSADNLAAQIGFAKRPNVGDTGTSILVIDSHFGTREHLGKIREGIERYYWPRIVDNRLEVRFFDGAEELQRPSPEQNSELLPYIRAYQRTIPEMNGRTQQATESTWQGEITRQGKGLGVLSLGRADTDPVASDSGSDENSDRLYDTVALIRTPRMVACYHSPYQRAVDQHFVGVFVAHDSINADLAKSEPPAHHLWDENADEMSPEGSKIVRGVIDGIKKQVREFLSRQRSREIEPNQGCPAVDRELSDLLRLPEPGAGRGHGGPGSGRGQFGRQTSTAGAKKEGTTERKPRLFQITFLEGPRSSTVNGELIVEAKVQLEVANAADRKASKTAGKAKFIQLIAHPRILVDDGGFDENELGVSGFTLSETDDQKMIAGPRIVFVLPDGVLRRECWLRTKPLEHEEQVIDLHLSGQFLTKLPEEVTAI